MIKNNITIVKPITCTCKTEKKLLTKYINTIVIKQNGHVFYYIYMVRRYGLSIVFAVLCKSQKTIY